MAALVVTVSPANGMSGREGRIGIFPGGATTTMYAAGAPFWVGYEFAADPGGVELESEGTRFELDVDGAHVSMLTAVHEDAGLPVRKTNVAEFPDGVRDMIRAGTFVSARRFKAASAPYKILFPIPQTQLASNPRLTQNPGY